MVELFEMWVIFMAVGMACVSVTLFVLDRKGAK